MARDRQRAKQRKARRAGQNPGPSPSEPHRENVPGELEHASGGVDEFDAALVSGAGGAPVDDDDANVRDDASVRDDEVGVRDDDARGAGADRDDAAAIGDDAEPDFDEGDDDEEEATSGARARTGSQAHAPTARGPARFMAFLRASWAELQRVQWPDRRQVFQATAVVLGFVIVAGVYLGVADRVAQEVVNLII
jgi:preprotein translocase SecE subunit